jgi:hypothetical protein
MEPDPHQRPIQAKTWHSYAEIEEEHVLGEKEVSRTLKCAKSRKDVELSLRSSHLPPPVPGLLATPLGITFPHAGGLHE